MSLNSINNVNACFDAKIGVRNREAAVVQLLALLTGSHAIRDASDIYALIHLFIYTERDLKLKSCTKKVRTTDP